MTQTTTAGGRIGRHGRRGGAAAAVLALGLLAAACSSGSPGSSATTAASGASTATTSGSATGGLDALVSGISKSSTASFSATYATTQASTGKSQTVTFAQAPPKSAIVTESGSFFVTGSAIVECQGSGSTATCTTLPSSMTSALTGLTGLFSPTAVLGTLKGVQAEAEAKVAGVNVSTSTATYGGLASDCVTVSHGSDTPLTYCGATSNGVLTYVNANGNTVTLTAFTANPPASTFEPPAGATVSTLPAGA